MARLDGHPRHGFRNGSFQHPARSLSVVLARGIIGCSNSGDFKPRMPVEQLNHPLADRAGGAEYSYFELAHSFFNVVIRGQTSKSPKFAHSTPRNPQALAREFR